MEVTHEMDAWQPNVDFLKHHTVRQANGAEQFRLGDFKKTNVRAVENYARRVDISPADSIFDGVLLMLGHCFDSTEY
jgi:hypothetical protein